MAWAQNKGKGKSTASQNNFGAAKTPVQQNTFTKTPVQAPKATGMAKGGAAAAAPKPATATKPAATTANKTAGKGGGKVTIPDTFTVNENLRYQGEVTNYWKFNGYGFVTLTQTGVVPGDRPVFVHWESITSNDRFPQLYKGMQVELSLALSENRGRKQIGGKNVTLPGGQPVDIQDQIDAEKKTFIGGQELRYTGKLNFYKALEGYGYITMDDGYAVDASVPKQIRCEQAEMNAGGKKPGNMKEVKEVEFGIWKNSKDVHKAYNVTLPGGLPLPEWEEREGDKKPWRGGKGWGKGGYVMVPWGWF